MSLHKRDLLALAIILAGFALVVLVMPIQRNYAYIDDWTYTHSVEQIIRGQGFRPSEYAQATLATHAYWGALFAALFGMSFSTMTAATMTLSFVAAIAFYVLLRQLGFGPTLSGLGTALLALNPYFLNLSYSFMTDITFLAMLLLSCLFYFRALETDGIGWLWVASMFGAMSFLTRQFGIVIPAVTLLWLLYARKLSWSRLAAAALIPAVAFVGYFLWSRGFGPTFSSSVSREELLDLVRGPSTWITRASHFWYLGLFVPGLMVPLMTRVRYWKIIGGLAVVAAAGAFVLWQVKNGLVEQGQGTLNELSYSWLQPLISNPAPIYIVGAALTVWLIGGMVERAWPGFVALVKRRREPQPSDFFYAVGIILFMGTYLISSGFLDRYWLPILPFLIAGGLMPFKGRSIVVLAPALVIFAVVAFYGATVRSNERDRSTAQWEAGQWLVAQGIPYNKIENGYSWDGYYLHDEPRKQLGNLDINKIGRVFPPTLVIDPEYIINTSQRQGYHVLKSFPYGSKLWPAVDHQWLVMQRN